MQIPCGILVDKLGQKIMLMCGFSLFIIGTLSIANADINQRQISGISDTQGTDNK
jgi:fucose permease